MSLTPPNLGTVIRNDVARRVIYAAYVLGLVVVGALTVWYGESVPDWLERAAAVLTYLGIPVGTLALANVATPGTPASGEPPSSDAQNGHGLHLR